MGKASLLFVFSALFYMVVAQLSSRDTQSRSTGVAVEYQENTLASEIARSAISLARQQVQDLGGPADSVIAFFNGYQGGLPDPHGLTTGDFQGGHYTISASKKSEEEVSLKVEGYFGGEHHVLEQIVDVEVTPPETNWTYNCGNSGPNYVDIYGIGMGDSNELLNNGASIALEDTSDIVFMKAQVGGRVNRIYEVAFHTSTGQAVFLTEPDTIGYNNMGYFQADLEPASRVTVDAEVSSNNGARGFVVYAHRHLPTPAFSEGRYLDVRLYHYGHTETFTIPESSEPRTIYVDFVMYDKDDDGRTVTLKVFAGDQYVLKTVGTPNLDRELSIETLALPEVPGYITTVYVYIYSNDSLYWKMAHLYTEGC